MGRQLDRDCGVLPPTFWEMLASTLVKDASGNIFFNRVCYEADCNELTSPISCGDPISDIQAWIVANGFTTDACGNPAIKFLACNTDKQ